MRVLEECLEQSAFSCESFAAVRVLLFGSANGSRKTRKDSLLASAAAVCVRQMGGELESESWSGLTFLSSSLEST